MDCMIDLEMMATTKRAAITQIAAVLFEPVLGGKVADHDIFDCGVTLHGQRRDVDSDTLAWWLSQDERARHRAVDCLVHGDELEQALIKLNNWYRMRNVRCVWAHGSSCDIAILEDAFAQHDMDPPWDYRASRDTRTWYLAFREPNLVKDEQLAHDAAYDAVFQARCVQNALR